MKHRACVVASGAALVLTLVACGERSEAPSGRVPPAPAPPTGEAVRPAAVAGLFYPNDAAELSAMVDRLLAAAPVRSLPPVRALICPHAGYVYSGPTAAQGYKLIAGRKFETVIILAASHTARFQGVSVPATTAYETPLGRVPVSAKAAELATQPPFVREPRCLVQPPPWVAQTPGLILQRAETTPETWEHSVEVHVPFLQRTLDRFDLLPLVFGEADPEAVAGRLAGMLDEHALLIASTDLSHYHPYDQARALDQQCVRAICELDLERMKAQEACGKLPVLTLMHLARRKGWQAHLLDYRNSGDTGGDKDRVVGYAAIAFCQPSDARPAPTTAPARPSPATPDSLPEFSPAEHRFLLELARETLVRVSTNGPPPDVTEAGLPSARLAHSGACFVTLTRNGQLRGCTGNLLPDLPLYQAVVRNTINAARNDARFPPVAAEELGTIHLEISVLTRPQPLRFDGPEDLLRQLRPRRDGVILTIGERRATFLPLVWEQIPDKAQFMEQLSLKAGCPPGAWRGTNVSVAVYQAVELAETR